MNQGKSVVKRFSSRATRQFSNSPPLSPKTVEFSNLDELTEKPNVSSSESDNEDTDVALNSELRKAASKPCISPRPRFPSPSRTSSPIRLAPLPSRPSKAAGNRKLSAESPIQLPIKLPTTTPASLQRSCTTFGIGTL
eukprot:129383_1